MSNPQTHAALRAQVRKHIQAQRITEAEFARRVGVPQSTIMRFLRGQEPRYDLGCRMAREACR